MARVLLSVFLSLFLLSACDDGDLEIETISFDNLNVSSCTNDVTATFLFKSTGKQALILDLPQDVIKNEAGIYTGEIPTNFKLFYRNFNEAVNTAYFCANYPPASPWVISQLSATGGKVKIVTKAIRNESDNQIIRYDHLITISELVIKNNDGSKLIDSEFIFGTYQTNPN
ncbi:hypothetical protein [Capnocytophaga canimorsus]|uniref:Lipoprotein n=2 Tax=Capnocytophaga canimorsus TaxID=28188 RepID=F9YVU9_CAPCC|nr:hypothetical protein [Capnocytophaga canimorsus]AEK23263.1 Conserved hypothetical protein [Capnocytophaga canimorsus Cc5]ATA90966.1 hypothetical protein CGC56_01520 [Capnocytophaga canimorsus]ATA93243.1 hypothetical protein CGC54_02250 [Capnocytophaga canimorsus]CEN51429.1 conserved hypothetical protein [Capnocytophaga canimorsus]GIM57887.1 hypothetical protein CAPN007_00950 [Capnocytophaga canimorsus]